MNFIYRNRPSSGYTNNPETSRQLPFTSSTYKKGKLDKERQSISNPDDAP